LLVKGLARETTSNTVAPGNPPNYNRLANDVHYTSAVHEMVQLNTSAWIREVSLHNVQLTHKYATPTQTGCALV